MSSENDRLKKVHYLTNFLSKDFLFITFQDLKENFWLIQTGGNTYKEILTYATDSLNIKPFFLTGILYIHCINGIK